MCKYCDDLKKYKTISIPVRTSMADDNICEKISYSNCKGCLGCKDDNNNFSINFWDNNLCINYYHEIGDTIIAPVSARFSINYCPICGHKINNEKLIEELNFW